jgi:glucose-1-phosphate thymidylyltransferase
MRKGIILAGGRGTRLFPATIAVSKQLLPIYDKPMVYYPLTTLMLSGIKDILIITTPRDRDAYWSVLSDGAAWGINIEYRIQDAPRGIAEAFIIAEEWLDGASCSLILGDNIFYGDKLADRLRAISEAQGNTIFAYRVPDPREYGVVECDEAGAVISIEEKPKKPKSNYAVTGLYFYEPDVVDVAKSLAASERGELEITDVNRVYMERGELDVVNLGRGTAWFDTGAHDAMLTASTFVQLMQQQQGTLIGCPEEVAWRMGWITDEALRKLSRAYSASGYGTYLAVLLDDEAGPSSRPLTDHVVGSVRGRES